MLLEGQHAVKSTHVPSSTEFARPSKLEIDEQLQRVICSESSRRATGLQRLLQCVGSKASDETRPEIKELDIAPEVFGCRSEYDAETDVSVRVRMRPLVLELRANVGGASAKNRLPQPQPRHGTKGSPNPPGD